MGSDTSVIGARATASSVRQRLVLGLGRERAVVAADHAAGEADVAQQQRDEGQALRAGIEFLVHVQVQVQIDRLRGVHEVAQGVGVPVAGVHETAEQRVRAGGGDAARQGPRLVAVLEQAELDQGDLFEPHAAAPFGGEFGGHLPRQGRGAGVPPVDVGAQVRGSGLPGPLQAALGALAQVGVGPVGAVADHRVDRAEQAGLHGAHARQDEGLVQVRVRIDHPGQHRRALHVPALAGDPDGAGDGRGAGHTALGQFQQRQGRAGAVGGPVGRQQPARQPRVGDEVGGGGRLRHGGGVQRSRVRVGEWLRAQQIATCVARSASVMHASWWSGVPSR
ncbi:hypothetical protein ACFJGX_19495 [Hydrogenophaga sp. UC242_50]|uniref:hypothetical protein n=1 Tax=Hydrogenophaga sp. UC242_50 TaxID=3350169 RepID=UPI0036D4232C